MKKCRLILCSAFLFYVFAVVAQKPITHTLPKPMGASLSVIPQKLNYFAKAKDCYERHNLDQASKMLSNIQKWNSEAYELAGDICYLWNATLWFNYYKMASEMGSMSAQQKLQRNVRLNAISVNGKNADFSYSNYMITNIKISNISDVEAIRREAYSGSIDAQFNLGRMYEYGDWVGQDYTQAAYWYDKSKENRHLFSTVNLAWLFSEGLGVDKNEHKAYNLYLIAAEKNNNVAIHNIGLCYEYGKGVEPNKTEAIRWFRRNMDKKYDPVGQIQSSAEYYQLVYLQKVRDDQKLTENACYWLYQYLHHNPKSNDAEIDLIIKQAETIGIKSSDIQSEFGRYYVFYRKEKDYAKGLKWLKDAEEKNNARAIRDIGMCYEKGYGVSQNLTMAKEYYMKAKELGYNADGDLNRLAKE